MQDLHALFWWKRDALVSLASTQTTTALAPTKRTVPHVLILLDYLQPFVPSVPRVGPRFCAWAHGCTQFFWLLPAASPHMGGKIAVASCAIAHQSISPEPALLEQQPFNEDEVKSPGLLLPAHGQRRRRRALRQVPYHHLCRARRPAPHTWGHRVWDPSSPPPLRVVDPILLLLHYIDLIPTGRASPRRSSSFPSLLTTGPLHLRSSLPLPHVTVMTTDTDADG
jgi:hypothetical protein